MGDRATDVREEVVTVLAYLLLEALGENASEEGVAMSGKLTRDHLGRGAVIYVRQSTLGQVVSIWIIAPRVPRSHHRI